MTNPGLYIYQELLFDRLINADGSLNPTDDMLAEEYSYNEPQDVLTLNCGTMSSGMTASSSPQRK